MENNNQNDVGKTSLLSPVDLVKKSWTFYKENFKKLWPIFFLGSLGNFSLNISGQSGKLFKFSENTPLLIMVISVGILISIFLVISKITLLKSISDVRKGQFASIKEEYKKGLNLFWSYVGVCILASLAILGASVFFIIPGLILFGYLLFYQYELIDREKKGMSSLLGSWHLIKNNWWNVGWRYAVSNILVSLPLLLILIFFTIVFFFSSFILKILSIASIMSFSVIAVCLGLFLFSFIILFVLVFQPLFVIVSFELYHNLRAVKSSDADVVIINKKRKNKIIFVSIIGIFAFIALFIIVPAFVIKKGVEIKNSLKNSEKTDNLEKKDGDIRERLKESSSLFPEKSISFALLNENLLEQNKFISKNFNFSIRIPKNWTQYSDEGGVIINPKGVYPEASFIIEPSNLSLASLKMSYNQISEELLEYAIQYNPDLKNLKFVKYKIGVKDVNSVSGNYKDVNGSNSYTEFYVIVDDLRAYLITVRSSEKDWLQTKDSIYSSIATFEVNK